MSSGFDFTPYVPIVSVALGALATLGGVWITARSTRKADEKRLIADEKRETTRIEREDAGQLKSSEEARLRKQTVIYEGLAQQFIDELSTLRGLETPDQNMTASDFDEWFKSEWPSQADMRLRRAIATLTNDDHRLRVTQLCDAILDHAEMADLNWRAHSRQLEILITLGFDLTSTYARGQDVDSDLTKRWNAFKKERQETEDHEAAVLKAKVQALVERVGKTKMSTVKGAAPSSK